MKEKTNFEQLADEQSKKAPVDDIRLEIAGSKKLLDTVGGIVELVIPRILHSILGLFIPGNESSINRNTQNTNNTNHTTIKNTKNHGK